MPHEESETVQDETGRWINIYGKKRAKKLRLRLEPDVSYRTERDAVQAAIARSNQYPHYNGNGNGSTALTGRYRNGNGSP